MPSLTLSREIIPADYQDDFDLPVEGAFDWHDVIESVTERRRREDITFSLANKALYLVVFESTRADTADPELIAALDDAAHAEAQAMKPEALLYYHAGTSNAEGRSRSWCLWTDDKSAREAVGGPAHQEAMARAAEFYGKNYAVMLFSVIPHDEGVIFVPHAHPTASAYAHEDGTYASI